jgi:hypothetical protein
MNEETRPEETEHSEPAGQAEPAEPTEQTQQGQKTKMCKLAVLSILCVVLAFVFGCMLLFMGEGALPNWIEFNLLPAIIVTLVIAPVLGIVALIRVKLSGGRLAGRRLAWLGLIIPVVVGVAFVRSKPTEEPKIIPDRECLTNLRRLAVTFSIYGRNNDGRFPTAEKWCDELFETTKGNESMFKCPSAKGGRCNYALNKYAAELGGEVPSDMVFLFESGPGWNQVGGPELAVASHKDEASGRNGCNIVFGSGRGRLVGESEINGLNWEDGEDNEETEEEEEESEDEGDEPEEE